MWIATKVIAVRRDGEVVRLNPGDPVPEAEFWPNRGAMIRRKAIRWIEREEAPVEPTTKPEKPKKAPPVKAKADVGYPFGPNTMPMPEAIRPVFDDEPKPKKKPSTKKSTSKKQGLK